MRVLLIGEFSGFHNSLKKGLKHLGCDVVLAGSGDGFKNFPCDIDIGSNKSGVLGTLQRLWRSLSFLIHAKNYDVVQFINPDVFPKGLGFNKYVIKKIIKRNKKSFLSACGDDYGFVSNGCKRMRYNPIDDALRYDLKVQVHPLDNPSDKAWWEELTSKVNAVIPVMHEYTLGYAGYSNLTKCIPLPVDLTEIYFSEMELSEVLTVFHGDNRYGFKGTRFVEEAFEILKKKYPNKLELVIKGKMPFSDYLALMQRTHIVIDQTNSYSCGMNALYAMAMGKVVLGGAEQESLDSLGFASSPVINITPSSDSIVNAIELLLNNKLRIHSIAREGRAFVEKEHCAIKVAARYISTWKKS